MNPERQRQHEAHKARQARMGRPVARTIVADVVREPLLTARRDRLLDQAERQHEVRVDCIRSYFAKQRQAIREALGAADAEARLSMRMLTRMEADALSGERELYDMDLREARA